MEPDIPFYWVSSDTQDDWLFFYPFIISNPRAAPGDTGNRKDIVQCLLTGSTVPQIVSLKHSQKLPFKIYCLFVCRYEHVGIRRPEEDVRSPGAEDTEGCKLPNFGAGD